MVLTKPLCCELNEQLKEMLALLACMPDVELDAPAASLKVGLTKPL
jgi:hypothetical protein